MLLSLKFENHVSINSLEMFKAAPPSHHSAICCLLYSVEAQRLWKFIYEMMRAEEIFLNVSWMARGNILYVAAAPGGNSPPYLAHFTCLRTVLRFVTYLHTGKAVSFDRYCSKLGSVMSYREILTFSLGVPVIILHISFWVWNSLSLIFLFSGKMPTPWAITQSVVWMI